MWGGLYNMKKVENRFMEIESKNGNKYVRVPDSHTTFTDKILLSDKRKDYLLRYNLIKENSYFNNEKLDENKVKQRIYKLGLQQLTLEVTMACNLRCKYCIFGGNYKFMRTHENQNMSWETCRKAVDIYFDLIKESEPYNYGREPFIGFYGGEPLINFRLIKKCIEYIEKYYGDYNVKYSITTNATLLSEEIIGFFYEHDVNIVVSLDGPEEEHNRNRVYQNGKGTFTDVITNINKIFEKYQRPVFTTTVYDMRSDIKKITEFYDNTKGILCLNTVPVKSYGSNYYAQFTQEEIKHFRQCEQELKEFF